MNQRLLALYGLKWNPFSPELPTEAIYVHPKLENFCWRIEHAQIREGGFAMIHGDPGTGKSVALRLLAERLARLADAHGRSWGSMVTGVLYVAESIISPADGRTAPTVGEALRLPRLRDKTKNVPRIAKLVRCPRSLPATAAADTAALSRRAARAASYPVNRWSSSMKQDPVRTTPRLTRDSGRLASTSAFLRGR